MLLVARFKLTAFPRWHQSAACHSVPADGRTNGWTNTEIITLYHCAYWHIICITTKAIAISSDRGCWSAVRVDVNRTAIFIVFCNFFCRCKTFSAAYMSTRSRLVTLRLLRCSCRWLSCIYTATWWSGPGGIET